MRCCVDSLLDADVEEIEGTTVPCVHCKSGGFKLVGDVWMGTLDGETWEERK
jgi:hypothetical protein